MTAPGGRDILSVNPGGGAAIVTYEIVLPHARSERLVAAFPEFACRDDIDRLVMRGELRDQTELHSVLARVADLGLEIETVTRIDSDHAGVGRDGA
jgi:hypothetical protein